MNQFFIGFDLLENFARQARLAKDEPIYLMMTCITRRDTDGSGGLHTWRITTAQIRGNRCHYWMRDVANARFFASEILPEHKDRENSANSAIAVVREYLATVSGPAGEIRVINALIAFPKDLQMLEGGSAIMGFDREKMRFYFRPEDTRQHPADCDVPK